MINADRNLLYGLAARFLGLASPAAIQSGLAASYAAGKPLGEVLAEQGAINLDQRDAIDRLVDQCLSSYEGDASRCLEALADIPSLLGELCVLANAGQGEESPGAKTRFDATLTIVAPPSEPQEAMLRSAAESRFRILRPHARGGLGEVFVAHDEELRREVALKQLHDRHADVPGTRARFMLEAEVTGALEHPGIVPVYSLGCDPEGRPYYAMRFIRGNSLKQAVDQYHRADGAGQDPGARTLELRRLLRRFIDVCNAIEYAHSRHVLHRDLKPENIMLGSFGETLVVDWGLAKPLRREAMASEDEHSPQPADRPGDTTRTMLGSAIGTPAYMSPEQAAGKLDQLGPASDVYSLGATLYYLLTGRPPIEEPGLLKLLERVQAGDFARPRAVSPRVPAALEAICLKAMSHEPALRYRSAAALAEDVDRWLADEPVAAYRAAWHERLARWGRRHRRSVEAAAAALAVITIVSIGASVLVHAAKREVEQERDEVVAALTAETLAKQQSRAALEAERAAKNEALRAIDSYVQLVSEGSSLGDQMLQPLRRQLLEDARNDYQALLENNGPDVHVRSNLAAAILRIGRLNNAAGSKQEARAAFQQARSAFQELVDEHPGVSKYRSDLALCYRSLGVLENEMGQPAAALPYFRKALGIYIALAALLESQPFSPDRMRQQIETACDLARCAPLRLSSEAERKLAQQADNAAIRALHAAVEAGFRADPATLRRLRQAASAGVPRFKAAVDKLGALAPSDSEGDDSASVSRTP